MVFRLQCDSLAAKTGAAGELAAVNRIIYVVQGAAIVRCAGQVMSLAPNSAWCANAACEVLAGANGAQILRWELTGADTTPSLTDTRGHLLLERELNLDAGAGYLLRCDRVDFPPGGIAYTHTHQGPGIRCLLGGEFTVDTLGHATLVTPGAAWFESGPDPVLASASKKSPAAFVRVMVLPRALKGKSSIRYVKPEDADKPKLQRYQVFVDEFIDL